VKDAVFGDLVILCLEVIYTVYGDIAMGMFKSE
jgi:hypothetical protein